ncbi:hypothetical protein OG613_43820 (plasmid) [Streptomyces sp. NBC_00015]|uniref:hypothetical protein n=1 Tax=Streptomyces sp. NBC_00015 TaxID=2903611 RepID=UPI00324577C1
MTADARRVLAGTADPNSLASVLLATPSVLIYEECDDGIRRLTPLDVTSPRSGPVGSAPTQDLSLALTQRNTVSHGSPVPRALSEEIFDKLLTGVLVLPRSERWREAVSTALVGDWAAPLFHTGHLPYSALGALKAEARTVHRQLVPVWRRRTRHGRVLSLDAALGDGLSLHDLVVADVDYLAHTAGGVFEEERLNTVLRALTPDERRVALAIAYGEGRTWTEAAAAAGAADPKAFGERVRRKAQRQAAEQRRRLAQRSAGPRPCTGISDAGQGCALEGGFSMDSVEAAPRGLRF